MTTCTRNNFLQTWSKQKQHPHTFVFLDYVLLTYTKRVQINSIGPKRPERCVYIKTGKRKLSENNRYLANSF